MSTLSSEKKGGRRTKGAELNELTGSLERLVDSIRCWYVSVPERLPMSDNKSIRFSDTRVSPLILVIDRRLTRALYYSPAGFEILGLEMLDSRDVALSVRDRMTPDVKFYAVYDLCYHPVDFLGMLLYTNLFEDIVNERYEGSTEVGEYLKRIGMLAYYGAEQGIHEEIGNHGSKPDEVSFLVSLPPSKYYQYVGLNFTTNFNDLYYVTQNTPGSGSYEVAVAIHPPTRRPSLYSMSFDEFAGTQLYRYVVGKIDELGSELHRLSNSMKLAFIGLYTYEMFKRGE